jgi:tetratricopeptide (TPR) repeat protein
VPADASEEPAGDALFARDPTWRLHGRATWDPATLPPAPWSALLLSPPEDWAAALARLELARRIKLFANTSMPPMDWDQVRALGGDEEALYQAFALALFDLTLPLQRGDPILDRWASDVRDVLHERRPLARSPAPASPLLAHGYRLLRTLSDLRDRHAALDAFLATGPALFGGLPGVLAVELVYWGEAAYCLTEQGDMAGAARLLERQEDAARRLQALVPGLEESLQGGLWRHHLGRLDYYRGRFERALHHYAMEWRLRGEQPGSLHARLCRAIGNTLADMGLLGPALRVVREAEIIQRELDDPELYKTLGRLGEIHARRGDYPAAADQYRDSWKLQLARPAHDGRTAVYLGNLAVLAGQFAEATDWFDTAAAADAAAGIADNPYTVMGRIALAARQGPTGDAGDTVEPLWTAHREHLLGLETEKVLPAAVACLAAFGAGRCDANVLQDCANRLIEERYAIEALPLLASLHARPREAMALLQEATAILSEWHAALAELPAGFGNWCGLSGPTDAAGPADLRRILPAVHAALEQDDWGPLRPLLPHIFPTNLAFAPPRATLGTPPPVNAR